MVPGFLWERVGKVVGSVGSGGEVGKKARDEIYSTVDASKTAHELWEAIERLQQDESLNIQDRIVNVVEARENVGSQIMQQTGIQCFNYKESGHFAKECKKPKRFKDSTYHKEKMLMYKQAEKDV
nr:hypothetical protein [Tanacetum cinerariifolium]